MSRVGDTTRFADVCGFRIRYFYQGVTALEMAGTRLGHLPAIQAS